MNKLIHRPQDIPTLGSLYVVATPLGNLHDISLRALCTLKHVDRIVVEDTRRTSNLLKHFGIEKNLLVYNKYNEKKESSKLIRLLQEGNSLALLSDAGTPIINDPGNDLVNACIKNNIPIVVIPGPCAGIVALLYSGLDASSFCYEGFVPNNKKAREKFFHNIKKEQRTIIMLETTHRIIESVACMVQILGEDRKVALARELTKKYEQIYRGSLSCLYTWLCKDKDNSKGEMVLVLQGYEEKEDDRKYIEKLALDLYNRLIKLISHKDAIDIVLKTYKVRKNWLYSSTMSKKNQKR